MKSAQGQGRITIDGGSRNFNFNAEELPTGAVQGTGKIHIKRKVGEKVEIVSVDLRISCLQVVWNMAFISGVVSKSTDPGLVDLPVIFWVQDNGRGAGSPPDKLSLCLICEFANDCVLVAPFGPPPDDMVFPVEGGNITVHARAQQPV